MINVSARAADLPARVQPPAPVAYAPSFSWTGFYVGGELGWIRTDPDYTTGAVLLGTPFLVSATTGKDGLSYGILAGYNYQAGNVVLGVEGDFEGWTVGKIRYTSITGDFLTAHSKWGGSVRGRLGFAADRALVLRGRWRSIRFEQDVHPDHRNFDRRRRYTRRMDRGSRHRLRLHEQLVHWR